MAKFLSPENWAELHTRLLLGNGASELIDLVTRNSPQGPWKSGPGNLQYMEYQRSARNSNKQILKNEDPIDAVLYAFVNPNNPTGNYYCVSDMKECINNVPNNATVIVDESMQPWHSKDFREDSLVSQGRWILGLLQERNISVYIIHSWTKLWTCCGLRIGSIVCPTKALMQNLKSLQVPWSVNAPALKYLETVTKPENVSYLEDTWEFTPKWRKYLYDRIHEYKSDWKLYGEPFLSWIWIDTLSPQTASRVSEVSKRAGYPIRPGKYGYNAHTFIRIAVRNPKVTDALIDAWKKALV